MIKIDTSISQAQKKIEYISYNEEDYRQIILREQALLDYHSDMSAYKIEGKIEGKQEMINTMRKSGMGDAEIEKIIKLSEEIKQ